MLEFLQRASLILLFTSIKFLCLTCTKNLVLLKYLNKLLIQISKEEYFYYSAGLCIKS